MALLHAAKLPFLLHVAIETAAACSFILNPASQLPAPTTAVRLILQSFGGLLLSTNLTCLIFVARPFDGTSRLVAASLAFWHVWPCWRAYVRLTRPDVDGGVKEKNELPETGLFGIDLLVVLHLCIGRLLAQPHLLSKQGAEQPIDRVLLPRPPVLGRHEVLQLLMHVEAHLAALARPPVDVLLRLGLLHRRPSHRRLRRRAVACVGRALLDELLEEKLVKVGVVVDVRVLVDFARHLRGGAGPRRARAPHEAVGVEELVLEAGDDRRLRRDEVARLDLDVGAARLGGPRLEHLLAVLGRALLGLLDALPDVLVRGRGVVVAALALCASGLLRELRGEQAGAEAVEGVEQLQRGLLSGLVRLRVLFIVFFGRGLDGGEGVCRHERLLQTDADVEEAVKRLALLADGDALLCVLLGGRRDCGGEGLLAFTHEPALLGSGVGLGGLAAGLLVILIFVILVFFFLFIVVVVVLIVLIVLLLLIVVTIHEIAVAALAIFRVFVVLVIFLLVRDKVGGLGSLAAAALLFLGLRAAAENKATEFLVVAVAKGVVARDFGVLACYGLCVGGQVGGLGVVKLFAAGVNVLFRILKHVAVVIVARIVQCIAADAGASVLRSKRNAFLFAELALATTMVSPSIQNPTRT
ncbi:hypothetical protein ColKHC_09787 [Colletotrichum higginsianum]|nr:hypothetical protein ColKHC_09787 [Colletotrichum higginsianum]